MKITKEQLVDDLAKRGQYYKAHVRKTLNCLSELIPEYFAQVEEDEELTIQIADGVKIGCKVMPERARKHPRDQSDIIVKPTVKPFAKFSDNFRENIQKNYEEEHRGE